MNEQEQRIAIAEACGWTGITAGAIGAVGFLPGRVEAGERRTVIPSYLNDLNAMHEAEKVLTSTQAQDYFRHVSTLSPKAYDDASPTIDNFYLHATAAIRAKAFLRTLGLWKESE